MKRSERIEYVKEYGLPLWAIKEEKDIRTEKTLASILSMFMLLGSFASSDKAISLMLLIFMVVGHFISIWR